MLDEPGRERGGGGGSTADPGCPSLALLEALLLRMRGRPSQGPCRVSRKSVLVGYQPACMMGRANSPAGEEGLCTLAAEKDRGLRANVQDRGGMVLLLRMQWRPPQGPCRRRGCGDCALAA
eukprot:1158865-Pelagomonas_calceolata.AAC.3